MFDNEYKTMMEKVAPDQALITETALKMQAMKDTNRKSPRMRRGFAVLAALVVIGVIGASAVTLSQRKLVEWNGSLLDVRLEAPEQKQETGDDLPYGALGGAPEGELWIFKSAQNWGLSTTPTKTVPTLEGIRQAFEDAAPEFQLPSFIPEGYAFTGGHVTFYASPATRDEGLDFLSGNSPQNGVTLERYKLPDSVFRNLYGYGLSFKDSAGHTLYISCKRTDTTSKTTFSMEEDTISEMVDVGAGQQGLYLADDLPLIKALFLRKNMTPVNYFDWTDLDDSQILPNTFDNAVYTISTDFLTKDQMIQIAQGLK